MRADGSHRAPRVPRQRGGEVPRQREGGTLPSPPPAHRQAGEADRRRPVLLGRQTVFTVGGARYGCELLYRSPVATTPVDEWPADEQDRATRHVVLTALRCGLEALGGHGPVFVNVTRTLLVGEMDLPPLPAGMGLEVVESVRAEPDVVAGVRALRDAGHLVAIDDFSGLPDQLVLLPDVDLVKIDLRDLRAHGAGLLDAARRYGATTVAERVETPDDLAWCRTLGFDLVQGNLLEPALVLDVGRVRSSGSHR